MFSQPGRFSTKSWPLFAGYLVLYVFLDWVSYIHPLLPLAITPWNPPPGLSLAFLLLHGLGKWPALFVAALLAEIFVRDIPAPFAYLAASSLALTACYGGSAALLLGPLRFGIGFRSLRDLSWFLAVALFGALLAALAYVTIYTFAGLVPPDKFLNSILRFWVGDVIGIMVIVPLLLVHAPFKAIRWQPTGETIAQAASVALALWTIFGLEFTDEFKFFYLLFLPLIWIATRHGIQGATIAILAMQMGLIGAVQWGGHKAATVVELQLLMLALTITGLFLGMAVTGRRRAEIRLRAQQTELDRTLRFATAGELASALAHELNQPLSALSSYIRSCQLLLSRPGDQHVLLEETMGKSLREAERAGKVVHRLRDFYRSGAVRPERVGLEQLLRGGIEPLLSRAAHDDISLHRAISPEMSTVWADRGQIETVLHNLISNAIDAIAMAQPGRREISVEAAPAFPGKARICVTDSGQGVPGKLQPRIFEPFTTGKPGGTGLGLALSRSLVKANGGELWLEENPGGGARFCFTLPVNQEPEIHD